MNRPIMVVGVQRSGTSVIAGILFKLGVYMGDWFLRKDKHNPTGYFEDIEFGNLDEDRWKGKIKKEEWTKKVKELLERRQQEIYGFTHWGWKSPASILFIKDYIKLCDPIIIKCTRNKKQILESMEKMYWKKPEIQYNNKKQFLDEIEDCLEVDFDNIKENTEYEIGRIIGYLKLNPSEKKIKDAFNSVIKEPNLKRQEIEHYTYYL